MAHVNSTSGYTTSMLEMAQALQNSQIIVTKNEGLILGLNSKITETLYNNTVAESKKLDEAIAKMEEEQKKAEAASIWAKIGFAFAALAGAILTAFTGGLLAGFVVGALGALSQTGVFDKLTEAIAGKNAPTWVKAVIGAVTTVVIACLTGGVGAISSAANIAGTIGIATVSSLAETNTIGNAVSAASQDAWWATIISAVALIIISAITFKLSASAKVESLFAKNGSSLLEDATQGNKIVGSAVGKSSAVADDVEEISSSIKSIKLPKAPILTAKETTGILNAATGTQILGSAAGGTANIFQGTYLLDQADILKNSKADVDATLAVLSHVAIPDKISMEALKRTSATYEPIWQGMDSLMVPLQGVAQALLG